MIIVINWTSTIANISSTDNGPVYRTNLHLYQTELTTCCNDPHVMAKFCDKVPEYSFRMYPDFLFTRGRVGQKKPPSQKPVLYVGPTVVLIKYQLMTDRHRAVTNTALA